MRNPHRPLESLTPSENQFRRQCYHEAGHALVAWCQGFKVECVYPQIANNRVGQTIFVQKLKAVGRTRLSEMLQRCRLTEKRVRICLAGPIAEVETGLVGFDELQLHADFSAARDLLFKLAPEPVERDAMMGTLYAQTELFIDQRMPQITRLAERLLRDQYLDENDMGEMLGDPRMTLV